MLDVIGESNVRMTLRTETNQAVDNKDIALQKIEKSVEERPVERSLESSGSKSKAKEGKEKKDGNYKIDDKGVYYEKYDKEGKVIFRTPPEKKPIDELA